MYTLRDEDNRRYASLDDGTEIVITLDDDGSAIRVLNSQGDEIGTFKLSQEEDGAFLITWMSLDKMDARYTRRGIGREALRFHRDYFGSAIYARGNDGMRRDDGSHLTGDAPVFVSKMRDEGIIEKSADFDADEN